MDPEHPILPDSRRHRIVALRWDVAGPEPFLDLTLRHTQTLAVRRLRFWSPRNLRVGEDFETCVSGLAIADIRRRRIEGVGVEVYNLDTRDSLRFLARDVTEEPEPAGQPASDQGAHRSSKR